MKIRPMITDDIDFALDLTTTEGWSDIRSDFSSLISYKPAAAFVLEEQDRSIGMISAVSYGRFGFIGSLIVSQSMRGRGAGEYLLKFAIGHLKGNGASSMMLDAVPEAMALYSKNGFHPVCKSLRLSGLIHGQPSKDTRQITDDDLPTVFEMDRVAFGGDRSHFLQNRFMQNPELCVCLEKHGKITTFAMGSQRMGHVRVAPWIVRQEDELTGDLLRRITSNSVEKNLALGVLESNTKSLSLFRDTGLSEYSYSVRMVLGDSSMCKGERQYAIGSPAKG